MDLGLQGRVALVCGASKGIGYGIAAALVAEGARVAITARSPERLETAAREIGALPIVHNSSDLDAVAGVIERVQAELGPIDVYVANTGGPPRADDPLLGFTREQWQQAHRTLLLEPMEFLRLLLPAMAERGFGRVVAVASWAALEPIDSLQLSNAHRPGLLAALHVLAGRYAARGVTINSLLPGRIATDRALDLFGGDRAAADRAAATDVPAGRLGTIEEMGAAAAFLCSAQASYITGTKLLVDGGALKSW